MPNFTARVSSGVTLETWNDPATVDAPPRVQATEWPLRRWKATVGTPVAAVASVGGAEGPLDGALGGALFSWWFAEWPGLAPPSLVFTAGQTSLVSFTPPRSGHYTLVGRRAQGGAVVLHVDARVPVA